MLRSWFNLQGRTLQTELLKGMESHLGVRQPGENWRGFESPDPIEPTLASKKTVFEMVDVEAVSFSSFFPFVSQLSLIPPSLHLLTGRFTRLPSPSQPSTKARRTTHFRSPSLIDISIFPPTIKRKDSSRSRFSTWTSCDSLYRLEWNEGRRRDGEDLRCEKD